MMPWQERLITEKLDLDDKVEKLGAFCRSREFAGLDGGEQYVLRTQLYWMKGYQEVLLRRVEKLSEGGLK